MPSVLLGCVDVMLLYRSLNRAVTPVCSHLQVVQYRRLNRRLNRHASGSLL